MAEFDVAQLWHPTATETFWAQYWERRPLHIQRNDPHYYDVILAAAHLDELVAESDGRYPAIRLAKGGAFFPSEAYTRDVRYGDEVFSGVPDVEKIFAEYAAGATVCLRALHRSWPPLGRLCAQLAAGLDHGVDANVYITPSHASGFTPHYDSHEVFILQIGGVKHWRVWSPDTILPHRSQLCAPGFDGGKLAPLLELDLHAGDFLYLPRGFVHTATTGACYSAHVTIAVTVYTWLELAQELTQEYLSDPRFREALPNAFASRAEAKETLKAGLAERLNSVHRSLNLDRVVDRFTQRVQRAHERAGARFQANLIALDPDTALRASVHCIYQIRDQGEQVALIINGRRILLPRAARPLLDVMLKGEVFRPESLPADPSMESRLSLCRLLLGMEFIVRA